MCERVDWGSRSQPPRLASPLVAQEHSSDGLAVDALRLTVDTRLVTSGEPLGLRFRNVHISTLTLESDSSGDYGLLGAFIGWAVTAVPTVLFCLGLEDADSGGCVLVGATVGGLPGFVIGGLIGASIEKSPPDDRAGAEQSARTGGSGTNPNWAVRVPPRQKERPGGKAAPFRPLSPPACSVTVAGRLPDSNNFLGAPTPSPRCPAR